MVFRCNLPLYPITIGTLLDEAVLNINTALQIEFVQPLQPSGQSMLQGQPKRNFVLLPAQYNWGFLLLRQVASALKQSEMHSESVGSQIIRHL